MKRYRPMQFDFDTRATAIDLEIQDDWEDEVREQWRQTKLDIEKWVSEEYGSLDLDRKVTNLVELGSAPFSVLAFHNTFFRQCRDAFIAGHYYPALTGVCALGERVLNHLLLLFRNDFRTSRHYKRIYRNDSIDDWNKAIDILSEWEIFLPDVAKDYRKLAIHRNDAIHFRPDLDQDARNPALEALQLMNKILDNQFGILGTQPWWYAIPGECFMRKSYEDKPFSRKVLIPRCKLVGPHHQLEFTGSGWLVKDEEYEDEEISDDEYAQLRNAFHGR